MLTYYSAIIMCVMIAMAINWLMASRNTVFTQEKRAAFSKVSILIAVSAFAEWVTYQAEAVRNIPFTVISNLIYFVLAPLAAYFLGSAIGKPWRMKVAMVPYFIYLPVLFLSPFLHCIFYVDETGVYHRGSLYWAYLLIYLCGMLYLIIESTYIMKSYRYNGNLLLISIIGFEIVGVMVQIVSPEVKLGWETTALTMLLYYSFYNEVCSQKDPVTRLLSRVVYDRDIMKLKNTGTFIMIEFPDIQKHNDSRGKIAVDAELALIGKGMSAAFDQVGFCYRVSGARFCAIIDGTETLAEHLIAAFRAQMDEARELEEFRHLPELHIGYAGWDCSQDVNAALVRAGQMNGRL